MHLRLKHLKEAGFAYLLTGLGTLDQCSGGVTERAWGGWHLRRSMEDGEFYGLRKTWNWVARVTCAFIDYP